MQAMMAGNMSWTTFEEYVKTNDTMIIPLGVLEEHGLHNPVGTDTYIGEAAAKRIGVATGIAVAPILPYGYASNVIKFAGSVSIDPMLYKKIVMSYAKSYIHHGIRRILFVNGHGGNDDILTMVCQQLFELYGCVATHTEWWEQIPQLHPELSCTDHGGYYETSMLMAVDESLVNMSLAQHSPHVENLTNQITYTRGCEKITDYEVGQTAPRGWYFKGARVALPLDIYDMQQIGNTGISPEGANKELGNRMMDIYVQYNVDLIRELKKIK